MTSDDLRYMARTVPPEYEVTDEYASLNNLDETGFPKGTAVIRILSGPFSGVVFRFGRMTIGEEAPDETVPLRFEYEVVRGLEDVDTAVTEKDPNLQDQLAAILYHIIAETAGTDTK